MLDDAYYAGYKIMKNKQKWSLCFLIKKNFEFENKT